MRFYYYLLPRGDPSNPYYIIREAMLVDAEAPSDQEGMSLSQINRDNCLKMPYACYLLSSLKTDYDDDKEYCKEVLAQIDRLQRKEIDHYIAGRNDFSSTMNQHEVVMENYIFGECYEWPLSTFPLLHYKLALQGWLKFLDMPLSVDSEMTIDLPDLTPVSA